MRIHRKVSTTLTAIALAASSAATAEAQLANASATTLGMGGNATAVARGIAAISMNPAGLGMPGSGFTFALAPAQARTGLDPVTLGDIADFQGELIPTATKEEWLARTLDNGGQSGTLGGDVSLFALSAGHFGLQVSSVVGSSMNLAPEVVELMLYGNAGRTGEPADMPLSGSSLDGFAVTTGALSFGLPLETEQGSMALGATFKYSIGHGLITGRNQGGSLQSDPIRVDLEFPVVTLAEDEDPLFVGSGFGLDVGFQMKRDRLSLGAAVLNVVHTFAWDEEKLAFRPGTALLEEDTNDTDFDERPFSQAPAVLRDRVAEMTFDPTLAIGAGYDVSEDFTVAADVRNRFGDGMDVGPKLHAGVGAEYRGLKVLHLRGGAAIVTDGTQFGGGASLVLGPVSLSAAGALRTGDLEDTSLAQFALSFGGR